MNSKDTNYIYTAAVSFACFDDLKQRVEALDKALPRNLQMWRFTNAPHDSDGVNFWRTTPTLTNKFKKNIVDISIGELVFHTQSPQSAPLFMLALDHLCSLELSEWEQMYLSFCTDCFYELIRTTVAGIFTIRPYVTLPASPERPQTEPYVPMVCQTMPDLEVEVDFRFSYFDLGNKDLSIGSRESLITALSESPVATVKTAPGFAWKTCQQMVQPAVQRMMEVTPNVAFRFVFTGPVDRLHDRLQDFQEQLGSIFERSIVTYGFAHDYDPLVGLHDAEIGPSSPSRFPILHKTIVTSREDVEVQIDGLLDSRGTYGLELQCNDRKRFEKFKQATGLNWIDGVDDLKRWNVLPEISD